VGFETPSDLATLLKPPVAKSLNAFFCLLVGRTLLSETSYIIKWDECHCPLLDFKPFSKGSGVEELEDENAVFKPWVIHKGGAKQLAQYAVFTEQMYDFTASFKVVFNSIL
jgi:hypothetical protein